MNTKESYRLLIGSVGDDSHSVGMALLEIAFREAGFVVKNIGILNVLDDFFYLAKEYEAIFISCINGHADLYLKDFPSKYSLFKNGCSLPKVWYLGGNLSVQESDDTIIRKYLNIGFDYVAPKPVSSKTILKQLKKDFYNKNIKKHRNRMELDSKLPELDLEAVDDNPMPDDEFLKMRDKVISSWGPGDEVRTADIKENHSNPIKNLHNLIVKNISNGLGPIIQPRTGVAHTSDEIDILKFLEKSGLAVSSIQLDAASRKNLYAKAGEGVLQTEKGKTSCLNGYPVPIHGVNGISEIVQAINTPFQIRAGSPDHRFVYEVALAGGATSLEGGFICYLFPYDKLTSPVECLKYWKYIDKLAHFYYQKNRTIINREYFGPLTCCLIEPCIPIVINIIQAILSARSGVKCISVGLAEQGNRMQDIAAIKVLEKMTIRYLAYFGFTNITVSTVYHQYMAAFPRDIEKARELICNSSITAALSGATRIMTKTPVESIHIPTKENNAEGLYLTKNGFKKAKDTILDYGGVQKEAELLEREVLAVMNFILNNGKGSVARGALKAFQAGILDIPFSPSIFNKNSLITAKDRNGAVRFVNPDVLPFPDAIKDFHQEKINERMILQRASKIHEILESDLTRIWKNDYVSWPLDGHYII